MEGARTHEESTIIAIRNILLLEKYRGVDFLMIKITIINARESPVPMGRWERCDRRPKIIIRHKRISLLLILAGETRTETKESNIRGSKKSGFSWQTKYPAPVVNDKMPAVNNI
jgi:hypothetical protein